MRADDDGPVYALWQPGNGGVFLGTAAEAEAWRLLGSRMPPPQESGYAAKLRSKHPWTPIRQFPGGEAAARAIRARWAGACAGGCWFRPEAALMDWIAANGRPWDGADCGPLGVPALKDRKPPPARSVDIKARIARLAARGDEN